jgi:hypothetical protein
MKTEKGPSLDRRRRTSSAHCSNHDSQNSKNIPFAEISVAVGVCIKSDFRPLESARPELTK